MKNSVLKGALGALAVAGIAMIAKKAMERKRLSKTTTKPIIATGTFNIVVHLSNLLCMLIVLSVRASGVLEIIGSFSLETLLYNEKFPLDFIG